MVGAQTYAVVFAWRPNGVVVNTRSLDRDAWPKNWMDFAKPKPEWRIAVGEASSLGSEYSVVVGLYHFLGEERTAALFKGIQSVQFKIFTGGTQGAKWVATAEANIGIGVQLDRYLRLARAGAPVAWLDLDPTGPGGQLAADGDCEERPPSKRR